MIYILTFSYDAVGYYNWWWSLQNVDKTTVVATNDIKLKMRKIVNNLRPEIIIT